MVIDNAAGLWHTVSTALLFLKHAPWVKALSAPAAHGTAGGVPTANEDFTLSYNCHQHARYMAENDLLTDDQIPGLPFASFEGQLCAQNGLVWLSDFSSPHWLPADSIDEWMGSVGHRLWMYYPTTTTFG